MTSSELKKKLESTLDHLKSELAQVRTGRVTPALLDSVQVMAYGAPMSVKEVGTINILDAYTLQISPWDKGLLESIEKAIRNSELKLNPSVNNDVVIVPVPPLTEERRTEFTKVVSTKVEESKVSMRSVRQDAMKDIDTRFSNKEFGEDDKFKLKDDVEDVIKEYTKKAEELGQSKKDEIMHVGA